MRQRLHAGFTLLEVMVVIILTGLVSTLLLQAIGFSLASYQRSHDFQERYQKEILAFGWLRASVENMMSSDELVFVFEGHSSEIQGFSLAPMFRAPGSLVKVKWTIRTDGNVQNLWYEENAGLPLLVFSFPASRARFKYRSTNGQWKDQWPGEKIQSGRLPWRIMLEVNGRVIEDDRNLLMATQIRRIPRYDYRALL